MSHSGSVIRPTASFGLIRTITAGFVVAPYGKNNEFKELIFRRPDLEEKYVVFDDTVRYMCKAQYKGKGQYRDERPIAGHSVKFNLKELTPDEKKTDVPELVAKLHDEGIDIDLSDIRFKATEIESVPDDYVLDPLFDFLAKLNFLSIERLINRLQSDGLEALYEFRKPCCINVDQRMLEVSENNKGELHNIDINRLIFKTVMTQRQIKEQKVSDNSTYYLVRKDFFTNGPGEHRISRDQELPTWCK